MQLIAKRGAELLQRNVYHKIKAQQEKHRCALILYIDDENKAGLAMIKTFLACLSRNQKLWNDQDTNDVHITKQMSGYS